MKKIFATTLLTLSFHATAGECQSVISLSKIVSTVVQDKESVEENAATFCSEYSRGSSVNSSTNFGASFKFLSASFGSAGATTEQVASKYCSAKEHYAKSNDAYKQYIESISPNAYTAYQRCLELTKKDMQFDINPATILPDEFSMFVGFTSSIGGSSNADLAYSASNGIYCKWNGNDEKKIKIPTGSTAVLECHRTNHKERAFVSVVRTDTSKIEPLTIPWQPYDDNGNPVDLMKEMTDNISNINEKVLTLSNNGNALASRIQDINNESVVTVYKCPEGSDGWGPGGAWGFYGCQGQITTQTTCQNIEYPHKQTRQCIKLGNVRYK